MNYFDFGSCLCVHSIGQPSLETIQNFRIGISRNVQKAIWVCICVCVRREFCWRTLISFLPRRQKVRESQFTRRHCSTDTDSFLASSINFFTCSFQNVSKWNTRKSRSLTQWNFNATVFSNRFLLSVSRQEINETFYCHQISLCRDLWIPLPPDFFLWYCNELWSILNTRKILTSSHHRYVCMVINTDCQNSRIFVVKAKTFLFIGKVKVANLRLRMPNSEQVKLV